MFDPKIFEEFAKKISEGLPPGVKEVQQEIEKNVKVVVAGAISKLDIVTKEEFEVQTQVLKRTREKVEALEMRVAELEKQLGEGCE